MTIMKSNYGKGNNKKEGEVIDPALSVFTTE